MAYFPSRRRFIQTTAASAIGFGTTVLTHGCASQTAQSSPVAIAYASGGTQAMGGNYPDPFAEVQGQPACSLTCAQALGPCYVESPVRQDVTEGGVGLPLRLALKVVGASTCKPIPDATVEIWSTDVNGVYSGQTPARMCSNGQPEARQSRFMRGAQTTSGEGRVDFDMVYPGWYPGRTPHIHLKVSVAGAEFIVTQLYFPDELSRDIYANHPDYTHRPQADTDNARDGLLRGLELSRFLLNTEMMEDGVLLAHTTIGLRSSTGEPLCRGRR